MLTAPPVTCTARCQALPGRDALLADHSCGRSSQLGLPDCPTSFLLKLVNLPGLGERTESEAGGPARTHTSTVAGACRVLESSQTSAMLRNTHRPQGMFRASGSVPPSLLRLAHLVFCSSEAVQASISSGLKAETAAHRYFHGLKRHLHRALPGHQDGPVPFLVLLSEVSASTEQVWSVWSARQLEVVRCAVCHGSSLWVFFCASVWLHRHPFSLGREAFVSKTPRVKMSCSTGASPSKAAVASLSHR